MSPHDIGSGRDAPNLPAFIKPSGLKAFSLFPQGDGDGPAADAHGEADEQDRNKGDGSVGDQSFRGCKPLQHLLGLGIGILGGNLMDLTDHYVAILGPLERNSYQEKSKKESKAQHAHHCAHAGPLAPADSNRAVASVTGDCPEQVGRQKQKQAEWMKGYR
jgi:hypothetical protein